MDGFRPLPSLQIMPELYSRFLPAPRHWCSGGKLDLDTRSAWKQRRPVKRRQAEASPSARLELFHWFLRRSRFVFPADVHGSAGIFALGVCVKIGVPITRLEAGNNVSMRDTVGHV